MAAKLLKFFALALLFVVIINTVNVDAAYRKPPFNGSIFGKRNGNIQEFDTAGKTFSAMCEIASEACQAWFPAQEK